VLYTCRKGPSEKRAAHAMKPSLILFAFRLLAMPLLAQTGDRVMMTCGEIRALKPAAADQGLEARLEGIVTVVPGPVHSGLIVQDATAGIWVELGKARARGLWAPDFKEVLKRVRIGDRVRLEGVTERGGFAPVILPRSMMILESGCALPEPLDVTVPSMLSGKHDTLRLRLKGVVQDVSAGGQSTARHLVLKLVNSSGEIFVRVPREGLPPEAELLDTQIMVTGTMISLHNSRAEMTGAVVVTDSAEDVEVLRASLPVEKAPRLSLSTLRPFEPGGFSNFRRRIVGTVTLWQPGRRIILQEGNAAVEVTTSSKQAIPLGSVVEAAGFISGGKNALCRMEKAVLRVLRTQAELTPLDVTLKEMLEASGRRHVGDWQRGTFDYHFRLVRLKGTLVESYDDQGRAGQTLLMRCDDLLLPVHWEEAPATFGAEWPPGSELAVSGVFIMQPVSGAIDRFEPSGVGDVSLLLRSEQDIELLAAASWWTRGRLMNAAWAALGLIAVISFLAWDLSRRVRRQAARIAQQNEAEIRFQATLKERNRLGADMHDGLQQFLAGLSMQLEAAQGSVEMGRDAMPSLLAAKKLLLSMSEDFRHCVNALSDAEAEMHLPAILERTSAIIRACHPVEITVEVKGEPVSLPGKAVANLMLIAQEAASNAVRHGKARKMVLRCHFMPEEVTVEVEDDGAGFDPENLAVESGHYGLINMRERIQRLGGSLSIISQRGHGARVTARLRIPVLDEKAAPVSAAKSPL